jgi:hypothetical protein
LWSRDLTAPRSIYPTAPDGGILRKNADAAGVTPVIFADARACIAEPARADPIAGNDEGGRYRQL